MRTLHTSGRLRLALGLLLLARPSIALRLTGTPATRRVLALSRLLGARYVGQAALARGVPHDPRIDATIEAVHAVSMLPLARLDRRHTRLALLSAGVAALLAASDQAGGRA